MKIHKKNGKLNKKKSPSYFTYLVQIIQQLNILLKLRMLKRFICVIHIATRHLKLGHKLFLKHVHQAFLFVINRVQLGFTLIQALLQLLHLFRN